MTPHVIYDTTDLFEASDELLRPRKNARRLHQDIKKI